MDFLLECIGFPPETDLDGLIDIVRRQGEPAAWRGSPERHRRLPLGGGLELRLDRDLEGEPWSLVPEFRAPQRLRVAVEWVRSVPDSPFDALLHGWADPPRDEYDESPSPGAYRLCTFLSDARRLPAELVPGHVLAITVAGFALEVSYVGPNAGVCDPAILEQPRGASIGPLGGPDDPGGCAEVSARIQEIRHFENPITGVGVEALVVDAPGRPLVLFVSRWQLAKDELPAPRPGWRIEGTFMFSGRVAGGVPGPKRRAGYRFG